MSLREESETPEGAHGGAGAYAVVNVRDGMKNAHRWVVLRAGTEGAAGGSSTGSAGARAKGAAVKKGAGAKKK